MIRTSDLALILLDRYQGLTLSSAVKADCVIDAIFDAIEDALIHGEEVRITGFGTFKTVTFARRKVGGGAVRKESAFIPERRVVRFAVSDVLKKKVSSRL